MDLYYRIKQQRAGLAAPVDTIGCASVGLGLEGEARKFQILVALLLSSQTRDEITHAAVQRLNEQLGQLTPLAVLAAPEDTVHQCIRRVGYHNKKLGYLYAVSKQLCTGAMPTTLPDVLRLPGVGKKMAHLYLQHACGLSEGIGVDTHVFRISRRLGLSTGTTPERVGADLERLFPRDEWEEINTVLVGFGQVMCAAVKPRCADCCVKDECPSSTVNAALSVTAAPCIRKV
ncbi:endonuclease III [Pancytospora philotis]|nr:endonuclease III [Pancytospora philotis]